MSIPASHSHRHPRGDGSPRLTRELQATGSPCSVNRGAQGRRAAGLRVRARPPYRPETTRVDHAASPSPHLLAQSQPAGKPGTHPVSDITNIPTREGWLYLAVAVALSRRSIPGWSVAGTMRVRLVTDALPRAVRGATVAPGALFHPDRGCQYRATRTRSCLARHGLRQSRSARGYCSDHALAESGFASLKSEVLFDGHPFASKAEARTARFAKLLAVSPVQ